MNTSVFTSIKTITKSGIDKKRLVFVRLTLTKIQQLSSTKWKLWRKLAALTETKIYEF